MLNQIQAEVIRRETPRITRVEIIGGLPPSVHCVAVPTRSTLLVNWRSLRLSSRQAWLSAVAGAVIVLEFVADLLHDGSLELLALLR